MDSLASNDSLFAQQLIKKFESKKAVIGVVGLGYVGLPLAVEKAKAGFQVIGFDIQQQKVDMVNKGENYISDVADEDLRQMVDKKRIIATSEYSFIKKVDAVVICVPTPLDIYKQPDLSYVQFSTEQIQKNLHPGILIVLESTTYPGTTEEVLKPTLEKSGLKCGKDFFLAYSPERIDPGNALFNTKNTPKVVGGVTSLCTKVAATLYRMVLEGDVHEVSSPAVAEMEKVYENTFRNINIALANEMAILCDKMGLNIWEVIQAAATKPYGFMPFYPGPGIGGHCIPIDPFYLTWKAREYNYHTRLIELAGEINNSMPDFVVEKIGKILNDEGKPIKGSTIYLLGVTYKKDISDVRESPVLLIAKHLRNRGATIISSDPYVDTWGDGNQQYKTTPVTEENLQNADIVVITTDHSKFDYDAIAAKARIILDTRNALKDKDIAAKYYRL
ncbi:UDP-N-acetyl-D-glucosamine dehydrogenase [Bacillus mesophilus]|uniref:Nucleotide sugar dehydrogenase n=1 Tax=Bacillus mesophilus TaxID=1808955 RepID=A0A6M0QAS2_9BACI|nr:nucleotide sugar dehydrogenase [Bacillus mesophilus]MBM7662856.1 UDP-N-acetyl-D-glucosamine dehydrogenase [Bacillus mesophilus]NEY73446.1 nucleotide sugar dehydrogenase [Bacillus mesophilus]